MNDEGADNLATMSVSPESGSSDISNIISCIANIQKTTTRTKPVSWQMHSNESVLLLSTTKFRWRQLWQIHSLVSHECFKYFSLVAENASEPWLVFLQSWMVFRYHSNHLGRRASFGHLWYIFKGFLNEFSCQSILHFFQFSTFGISSQEATTVVSYHCHYFTNDW